MSGVVACVGIAVHDHVFRLAGDPVVGSKNSASSVTMTPGGPSVNAAKTIVALGGHAVLVAAIGGDEAGKAVIDALGALGVSTEWVEQQADVATSHSCVILHGDGERTIVNAVEPGLVDRSPPHIGDAVANADAILVEVRWTEGAIAGVAHDAASDTPVVVDFDAATAFPPRRVLDDATHVVFSRDGLASLVPGPSTEAALREVAHTTSATVGVTIGAQGSLWVVEGELVEIPAFATDAVNTLGAGDVFHGAFALAIARGRETIDAATWATAAASLSCSHDRGVDSQLSPQAVDDLVASR